MTAPLTYQLNDLRLSTAPPLGEGGAALIRRCTTTDGQTMLFKRYNEESLKDLDESALRHLIEWPGSLAAADRQPFTANCAWPQALVIHRRSAVGVLMNEAPNEFFYSRKGKSEPRHFNLVAVRKEQSKKRGYPYYDFPQKIARLGHVLSELQLFHSKGIVVGDLQTNNILTTGPEPDSTGTTVTRNFWLDCDSFILGGRAALPPMDPLSTRPPYPVRGFSAETDMYKFALIAIRCLSEHLGADTIDYEKFSQVLASSDFDKLEKLLTLPNPGLTSNALSGMARAWSSTVKRDGKMYCRTDASLRELWTDEKRQKHLAGIVPLTPPGRPRALAESSQPPKRPTPTSLRPQLPMPKSSAPPATKPKKKPGPADPIKSTAIGTDADLQPVSDKPDRSGLLLLGALVAVLIVIVAVVVALSQGDRGSSASSYPPTTTTSPTTPTTTSPSTTTPVLDSTAQTIVNASVGDCIHQVRGQMRDSTTYDVTVTPASCGTSYATDQVMKVTNDTDNCSGYDTRVFAGAPRVVLCLNTE